MKVCPSPEILALYAGEELDTSERAGLTAHLAECSACSALVADLQFDRELLRKPPDISEEAIEDVHRRVMSELPRPGSRRRYLWPAAVAACVALLALSSISLQHQPPSQTVANAEHRSNPAAIKEKIPELQQTSKVNALPARPTRRRIAKSSDAELIAALDNLFETEQPAVVPTDDHVVITMLTEDPDVTIVLLADSTGGSE